jgi:hypothetical protein
MFVSYLKSNRASRAELEAASVAQHHSRRMQDRVYDQQEQLDKLQPIYDFNERVFTKVMQKLADSKARTIPVRDEQTQQTVRLYQQFLEERQCEFEVNQQITNHVISHSSADTLEGIPTEASIQKEERATPADSTPKLSKLSSQTQTNSKTRSKSPSHRQEPVVKQMVLFE